MLAEITFQYSAWYYVLCLALGALYALGLYWRDRRFLEVERRRTLLAGLSFLRFAVVSFAAFLLLAPLLRSRFTDEEKPVVVLVHDNSSSITINWSQEDSARYRAALSELSERLAGTFDFDSYVFGNSMAADGQLDFSEKATDISNVIEQLSYLYANRNVGAVILASDGIFNMGSHPLYSRFGLSAPIYTVGLGDSVQHKDLRISRTYFNKIVYLHDRFNVQLDIQAAAAGGETSRLNVFKVESDGSLRKLMEKALVIDSDNFFLRESFVLDATQPGTQRYRVSLSPLRDEVSIENNSVDIFIDVLDSRKKVLVLANAPHPDISAIRQSLEKNRNYEVTVAYAREFNGAVAPYNLVVLHQIPSAQYPSPQVLKAIGDAHVATLFILGEQSSVTLFNQAQAVVEITGNAGNYNDAQPVFDQSFSTFTTPGDFAAVFQKFPPLRVPFGEFNVKAEASVLFRQKIGAVTSNYPLVMLSQTGRMRTGIISGEGLWRWRLYDFMHNRNHDHFDEFMSKFVQFLSVKEDKRRFRVILPKNIFSESEQVTFDAEFYNESYELVNEPDVKLTITDERGREFPYQFNRVGRAYRLDAGRFAVGSYTFKAETRFDGKLYTFDGQFSVSPVQLEAMQTTADHRLLYNLSAQTGGEFFTAGQVEQLTEKLLNSADIKPILHVSEQTRALINLKWIFFILLGLLAMEWFVRKWMGAY